MCGYASEAHSICIDAQRNNIKKDRGNTMKRSMLIITLIAVMLMLASCTITISVPGGQTRPPIKTPALPIFSPSQETSGTPLYTPPPILTASPEPYNGPAIMSAYSDVLGGYADGQWLTHSGAAAYCEGALTFYRYNLAGLVDTVESSGVTPNDNYGFVWSHTLYMGDDEYDDLGSYTLEVPHLEYGDYAIDPLSLTYMFTIPPERLPVITLISDTAPYLPAVQQRIDANLGAGAAAPVIRTAISADIDGDGLQEVIINADNCAGSEDSPEGNIYSFVLLLESDGSLLPIEEFYAANTGNEYEEAELIIAASVIDLDGDGIHEIIIDNSAYEAWWAEVMKYDGHSLTEMMSYGTGV